MMIEVDDIVEWWCSLFRGFLVVLLVMNLCCEVGLNGCWYLIVRFIVFVVDLNGFKVRGGC